jgi:hypothetical protein
MVFVADAQRCATCGKQAPETETNYTLISAQFGWRLSRYKKDDGSIALEWRCPNCWREFKRGHAPSGNGPAATPSASGSRAPGRPSSAPPESELPPPPPPRRPGRLPR